MDDAFLTLQPSLEEISSKEKPAVLRMYSRQTSHQFSRQISEKGKGEKTKSEVNKKKARIQIFICPSLNVSIHLYPTFLFHSFVYLLLFIARRMGQRFKGSFTWSYYCTQC